MIWAKDNPCRSPVLSGNRWKYFIWVCIEITSIYSFNQLSLINDAHNKICATVLHSEWVCIFLCALLALIYGLYGSDVQHSSPITLEWFKQYWRNKMSESEGLHFHIPIIEFQYDLVCLRVTCMSGFQACYLVRRGQRYKKEEAVHLWLHSWVCVWAPQTHLCFLPPSAILALFRYAPCSGTCHTE